MKPDAPGQCGAVLPWPIHQSRMARLWASSTAPPGTVMKWPASPPSVSAKRYLCATDPTYLSKLSAALLHMLSLQGGPMMEAEVEDFRRNPFHHEAVRVRIWDEGGKVAGLRTRRFRDYAPLLQRVVDEGR